MNSKPMDFKQKVFFDIQKEKQLNIGSNELKTNRFQVENVFLIK